MQNLPIETIVTIIFGVITVIMSGIALRSTRRKVDGIVDEGRRVVIFLYRESMLKYLLTMYDRAKKGDTIWGQCVGCSNYSSIVRSKILEAAGKGVGYKMIANDFAPALDEFRALYEPINNAQLAYGTDNSLRIQGLSLQEVVIAFPGVDSYTAVLFKDPIFIKIMKMGLSTRFALIKMACSTES